MMKKMVFGALLLLTQQVIAQVSNTQKMNTFITNLMRQMTLDEKIGQLNLVTPGGGIPTGAVVSTDVESKIKPEMWVVCSV
jgi:beta-glucosidase